MGYLKQDKSSISIYGDPMLENGIVNSDLRYAYFGQLAEVSDEEGKNLDKLYN